jgi:hypothetical protein
MQMVGLRYSISLHPPPSRELRSCGIKSGDRSAILTIGPFCVALKKADGSLKATRVTAEKARTKPPM